MSADPFVSLAAGVAYRGLETPCLFHVERDELYELEESGLNFVAELEAGKRRSEIEGREVLAFAEGEGLLAFSDQPAGRVVARGASPLPSLRYLELILTYRCNLRCRHCYLAEPRPEDLDPATLGRVISEFDEMQGLRLLLSGGEPLLYPFLDQLPRMLAGRGFRTVLLTNGWALTADRLSTLPVHEVQVSLDGMAKGHDSLRGQNSFQRAMAACRATRDSGKDLSIATMIHPGMAEEIDELSRLVRELGAREWSLEVPTPAGRWQSQGEEKERRAWLDRAAELQARGFGGSYHGAASGFACGHHLASILPRGDFCKCGFYADAPLGNLSQGLRNVWAKKPILKTSDLATCRDCPALAACGGGCRFRAGGQGPDPVMCAAQGWPKDRPGFGDCS